MTSTSILGSPISLAIRANDSAAITRCRYSAFAMEFGQFEKKRSRLLAADAQEKPEQQSWLLHDRLEDGPCEREQERKSMSLGARIRGGLTTLIESARFAPPQTRVRHEDAARPRSRKT